MKILILSKENSCRSQMAQAFFQSFDPDIEVLSAGTNAADKIDPLAVKCMSELDIDISKKTPTDVKKYIADDFDFVITISVEANANYPNFTGDIINRAHKSFMDPSKMEGTDEEKELLYKDTRDKIKDYFFQFYLTYILGINDSDSCGSSCSSCGSGCGY